MRAQIVALGVVAAACAGPEASPLIQPHAAIVQALRPTDTSSNLMWRFGPGEVVEAWGADGGFLVHYTRVGANAVPALDVNDSGVPDFVEAVDTVYEAVGQTYHGAMGFRRPVSDLGFADNGGDGRFDVYLLDFARAADGAFRVDQCPTASQCMGYVVQENDFAGYGYPSTTAATRILGSHEYFHAVQAAYSNQQDVVVSEGTAVWATEQFDPATSDFEGFIGSYLERVDRSIDAPPPGPVPSFAYGSAVFFEFLSQRFEPALIRKLWEHLEPAQGDPAEPANVAAPTWVVQLDALLKREHQSSFAKAFAEFATWNVYLGSAADPLKAWKDASRWPQVPVVDLGLPASKESLRVYYASAQYFRTPGAGRPTLVAALVDNPATPESELDGLALVIATRKAGRNLQVVSANSGLEAGLTVDTSDAEQVVIGVINTRRAAMGAVLSQRPSLCAGAPGEVATCRAAFNPSFDAGVDAGMAADAGAVQQDAGSEPAPMPSGCACGTAEPLVAVLAFVMARLRARASEMPAA